MIQMRLNNNGLYTVLDQGLWKLLDAPIAEPDVKASDSPDSSSSGGERFQVSYQNTETIVKLIYMGPLGGFGAAIEDIQDFARAAKERNDNKSLPPVYLEEMIYSNEGWWRSEVMLVKIAYPGDTIDWPWPSKPHPQVNLSFRRRYFWEQAVETQASCRNVHSSSNWVTSAVQVDVFNDYPTQNRESWIEVDATNIPGDLPAAARVVSNVAMDPTGSITSGSFYRMIWAMVANGDLTFPYMLEGEAASGGTQAPTPGSPDYVNFSGGYYRYNTIPSPSFGEMMKWAMDATFTKKANSRYFHIWALMSASPPADTYARFVTKLVLTTIDTGPSVALTTNVRLQDLGTLKIPPYEIPPDFTGGTALDLSLEMKCATGSQSLGVDCLWLLPTEYYCLGKQLGYGLSIGTLYELNGVLEKLQSADVAKTSLFNIWSREGGFIYLEPRKVNRIYHFQDYSLGWAPDSYVTMTVYYRARRLSL